MMLENVCKPNREDSGVMYGMTAKGGLACENLYGNEDEIPWERKRLEELERDIEKYDKIILIWEKGEAAKGWLEAFYKSETIKHTERKILVLSVVDMQEQQKGRNVCFRPVTETEAKELCHLHHMYEFSDRFQLLTQERCFGGILNFVEEGILTKEEALRAILFE